MTLGCPPDLALQHLVLRLQPLVRVFRAAIARRAAGSLRMIEAGAIASAITRGHADAVLDRFVDLLGGRAIAIGPAVPTDDELAAEAALRVRARAHDARLPLDAMAEDLGIDELEQEVLVMASAVELDSEVERVLGFVHDDASRRTVSMELACTLTASSLAEQVARRTVLGGFGRLRRLGLLAASPRETGLRDELRVTSIGREALAGTPIDLRVAFRDPAEFELESWGRVPADEALVARAAESLTDDRIDVVGIWGPPGMTRDVVAYLAQRVQRPIRRHTSIAADAAAAVTFAAALGALLWIDLDMIGESVPIELLEICRCSRVPLIVSGANPWRPTDLLAYRRFIQIEAIAPDQAVREQLWRAELPALDGDAIERVASTFHFDATEVHAAARTARAIAAVETNGHVVTTADSLGAACFAVARKCGERHTTMIRPQRGADDLVLPPELHTRVLDLAHNFRALPRVMDDWGFARRTSGRGLKGLFTGEPGTGKTLAAEVIAYELGLPMLRVDLARVVSKWIGETEKNLDLVFNEARDSHAVLFFDEAEALFGARGDVRHGTDRYANLEVSYLLQRFEDHGGIVILATNLRDKIDQAFMRRFHVVVGFPRPGESERRRLWRRAFTPAVPVAGDLDIATLARLDLTGAGIVGAAQTAALHAARENAAVSMRHIVHGLVRQYQREARVLSPEALGVHRVHAIG
jgi:hypothetical protein